jgi:hypothetical protein
MKSRLLMWMIWVKPFCFWLLDAIWCNHIPFNVPASPIWVHVFCCTVPKYGWSCRPCLVRRLFFFLLLGMATNQLVSWDNHPSIGRFKVSIPEFRREGAQTHNGSHYGCRGLWLFASVVIGPYCLCNQSRECAPSSSIHPFDDPTWLSQVSRGVQIVQPPYQAQNVYFLKMMVKCLRCGRQVTISSQDLCLIP